MMKNKLERTLLLLIIGLGVFSRFWQLDAVPAGFYHDEMDHVFTGEAVARWGTDITGQWSPWQLQPLRTSNITAEWPALFHALVQKTVGYGPQTARMTNALFGIATVLVAGLLAYQLTGNSQASLWAMVFLCVNPWHIHISRMGYEATISLFFQIIMTIGLLQLLGIGNSLIARFRQRSQAAWTAFWFLVTVAGLVPAYYTYHGAKFTVGVLVIILLLYKALQVRRSHTAVIEKRWLVLGAMAIVAVLGTLYFQSMSVNRSGGFGNRGLINVFNIQQAQTLTDLARRDRIPFITDRFVVNKMSVSFVELARRYWFTFDPYRLWIEGVEGGYQFSLVVTGYFGLSVLVGLLMYLYLNNKLTRFWLFTALILVTPVATVLADGKQASFRSAFTYVLLLIAGAYGWVYYLERPGNYKRILRIGLPLLVLFETVWFGLQYFGQYPLLSANNHYLDERLVARYVRSVKAPTSIVTDRSPYSMARALVFYGQLMGNLTANERAQFADPFGSTYRVGTITITQDCPLQITKDRVWVIENGKWQACKINSLITPQDRLVIHQADISSPMDSGTYYVAWNDQLCTGKQTAPFIHLTSLRDLAVELMSDEQFCKTWIKG